MTENRISLNLFQLSLIDALKSSFHKFLLHENTEIICNRNKKKASEDNINIFI